MPSGKPRQLARLCEHDSLHAHHVATSEKPQPICPGGEFLPEGALVIEKVDGEWPKWALDQIRYRGKAVLVMDTLVELATPPIGEFK